MKRSEMLKNLEYVIEDYLGSKINHPDVLAELILTEVERADMLPPPVGIGEEDQWGYLQYENEWEKE